MGSERIFIDNITIICQNDSRFESSDFIIIYRLVKISKKKLTVDIDLGTLSPVASTGMSS